MAQAAKTVESFGYRAPELGTAKTARVTAGEIAYFDRGRGRPIVFSHGWLTNANLWRKVVPLLEDGFRCIVLDLPFGGHSLPALPDADLTPRGSGAIILDVVEALGLAGVTLVGNDSGGAYSQIGVAARPERVARMVLTSCETPQDSFPPPPFTGLRDAALSAETLKALLGALRTREVRLRPEAFGKLAKRPIEDAVFDSYVMPLLTDDRILYDAAKVMRSASESYVQDAAKILIATFHEPVLFAWASEDPVFPFEHAQNYARALSNARVERIGDSYGFVPEDQPARLAELIGEFAALG